MTPQERAAAVKHVVYMFGVPEFEVECGEYENALAATVTLQREARRAALLEAAQMIEDDCYGGVDYFSDADTTLSFTDQMKRAHNKNQAKLAEQVRKLAQEEA